MLRKIITETCLLLGSLGMALVMSYVASHVQGAPASVLRISSAESESHIVETWQDSAQSPESASVEAWFLGDESLFHDLAQVPYGRKLWCADTLHVPARLRDRGLREQLLRELQAALRRSNCEVLVATLAADSASDERDVYLQSGFRAVGQQGQYLMVWEP